MSAAELCETGACTRFLERVRCLPSNTLVHIPIAMRERMCAIMAETVEGCASGDAVMAVLEEARSKLLLLPPPKDFSMRTELATRLWLWRDGGFLELLTRAEEQARVRSPLPHPPSCSGNGSKSASSAHSCT